MKTFITGGAGFIGSSLSEKLIKDGHLVTVYDNFSSGQKNFLSKILLSKKLKIIEGDVLDFGKLSKNIKGNDFIYHLSANPDVRKGSRDTKLDLEEETIVTYNVLEAMRKNNINKIVFPSSMTVYGKASGKVDEKYGPCMPISLYGAAKLSCEAMISAFCESFGMRAWVFRFANVIGKRLTHGVIYDLINKLINDPKNLQVLGNGNQSKQYILLDDVLDGLSFALRNSKDRVNLFNLGVSDAITVKQIVKIIIEKMNLKEVNVKYQKNPYGWIGDVPTFNLDSARIKKLGFSPKYSSYQAVEISVLQMLKDLNYETNL
ncbi:MAG: NAD-dependent epimerase/dehydratase family protein [Candidatus Levybacteria bacterium]|nr:NAD-dependent epimerase/dehydratase family protein [Candidatus Levybacteria bacterium]